MVSVCPSDCLRKYCHKFVSSRICSTSAIRRVPCWGLLGLYAAYLLINSYWNSNSEMCAEWRRWVMFFLFGSSLLYSSEDMVDFLKKFVWSSINLHMSYETNGHGHWNCTRTQPMNFFGMAWHGTARHTQNPIHLPYSFSFNSIFKLFIHSFVHPFLFVVHNKNNNNNNNTNNGLFPVL